MTERDHDIVLFGASGFVGRLVARQLAQHAPSGTRVALAGRTRSRVEAVRDEIGVDWPVVVADSAHASSMRALAESTGVVISTVGPYARHGLPLVKACAEAGTDYTDLTGEVLFVRQSLAAAHPRAGRTGARIVHSCGFDSVPSDLAVLLLADRAAADGAGELTDVDLLVRSAKGGFSGGTIDSLRNQLRETREDPSLRKVAADPYALSPDRQSEPHLGKQPDFTPPTRLDDGTWVAPFVMAPYNTRVVRRSNSLLGHRYGRTMRYRESVATGDSWWSPVAATGAAVGQGLIGLAVGQPFLAPVVDRILPSPGEGPSEKAQREGHFRIEVRARTTTGARYRATVAAKGDPGYAATSVMLAESALELAATRQDGQRGGVLTPAVALGEGLVDRLRGRGFTFDVEPA
ncbi:enoyl-ACP reductase [Nakamurella flava]|uniref:Enoyl-ACP reductase n=1 Tax=Nakamurella flava TaxID=2576308 RepID=A0A4U6QA47_9ACTN|nr:saccharopine dehydrogenase NADP-binding domain-containing protein [Nakamurella flava]TKV56793.1 enoyl-ACP reductase [Nakamurella flava]